MAVLVVDRELRIRNWPLSAQALFGWSRDEALGKPAFDLLGSDGSLAVDLSSSWRACRFRGVQRLPDGSSAPLQVTFEPVQDGTGGSLGVLTVAHELATAVEAEARYQSVIAAMQEGVIVMGLDGEILAWNAAAERILGLTAEQLRNRTVISPTWRTTRADGSPFPVDEYPAVVTARTGVPQSNVLMGLVRPDGAIVWLSINSQPIRQAGAPHHAVVATFTDVTERREAERRLREALDNVKALSGLLPVCAWCKSVRNDAGYWQRLEEYLETHTDARPTHGVCPKCSERLMP